MKEPLYLIAGRLRATGKAVLNVAYSAEALAAEVASMASLYALPWRKRENMSAMLLALAWLKPVERRDLSRRLKALLNLYHD